MKSRILCLILLVSFFGLIQAQTTDTSLVKYRRPVNTGKITLGITGGISSYLGDLNFGQNFTSLSSFRLNYGGQVEKRFGKVLGVSFNANFGKVSQNERSLAKNINFESSFSQFGIAVTSHFDWYADTRVAPFLSAGINYMKFRVYSDLKDAHGNTYYYWSDGKIHVLPQKDSLGNVITYSETPAEIQRDYTYESSVKETSDPQKIKNYSTTAFVIPLTVGVKFKMAEFVEARFSGSYNILLTDYLDNYYNGVNDAYLSANFSLHYTIGKKYVSPQEAVHQDVDFKSIAREDADQDHVSDMLDECPHTPHGVDVDPKGCPWDDDADGVANYLDKEPGSVKGAVVNRDGITLSEAELKKLYELRESTYMEKVNKFYEQPSEETLRKIAEDLNKEIDTDLHAQTGDAGTTTNSSPAVATAPSTGNVSNTDLVVNTTPTVEQGQKSAVPSTASSGKSTNTETSKGLGTKEAVVEVSGVNNNTTSTTIKESSQIQNVEEPKKPVVDNKINSDGTISTKSSTVSTGQVAKPSNSPKAGVNNTNTPNSTTNTNTTNVNPSTAVPTNSSAELTKEISSEKVLVLPMPANIRFADKNGDGKLQPKEITTAIDEYLEGDIDVTVTDIMDMIDYFFSQQ